MATTSQRGNWRGTSQLRSFTANTDHPVDGPICPPQKSIWHWDLAPDRWLESGAKAPRGLKSALRIPGRRSSDWAIGGSEFARKRGLEPDIAQIEFCKYLSFSVLRGNCTTPWHPVDGPVFRGWSCFPRLVAVPKFLAPICGLIL